MQSKLISIMMPMRNGLPFVIEAIDSVLNQESVDWELIVVDDHSEDSAVDILLEKYKAESRIVVLKNRGKGIIDALETAFSVSKGDFITRMDSDDIMPAGKLEKLLSVLGPNQKLVATGMVKYFAEYEISEGYKRYEFWLNELVRTGKFAEQVYRECVIASPNWMVHRSCFETDIQLSSLNYPEDYDLVFRWLIKGYKFTGITELTHLWRDHGRRTSRNSIVYQQESFFRLKTEYFVKIQHTSNTPLQLVGTGKKGKLIARFLKEKSVAFEWFTFEKKSGYKSIQNLESENTILTYWPTEIEKQNQIISFLKSKNIEQGLNLWLF